ncbi:aminomethyl-transferring glycine dehydrogenase subunit GcvPA [Fluviispira multicolorata]|uniref:Probable glycine dehydrogenase (decarboxylating) subunit 1 n=1 Tax=Fluviispira multicolorata TaxID=2654512 RepID=A0A833N1Q2_9BACT|nr:aminomethyl-transferring glycine dehydrogenase subunit GcvPA [Fluviispira multicolorata]KAB8031025.1 aminomethyl-transferring glycine dehydrogenase subunit GcvPA [Fluviispira multicolorata]
MSSHRFLPTTELDKKKLLAACGVNSLDDLLKGIPEAVQYFGNLNIGKELSEFDIKRKINDLLKNSRSKNSYLSFLGAGVYDHYCPAAVNQLTLRGEFLTSYTPYQPEISQGTLQALFEFQSMIAEIFGMDISSASHYDGSTSLAESALMAMRMQPNKKRILVSGGVHPEYIEVLKTYVTNLGVEVTLVPLNEDGKTSQSALKSLLGNDVAIVIAQSPNFMGCIEDMKELSDLAHSKSALFSANVTEPLSLALLKTPGEYNADIATGEGQSFGLPQSFGGPYLGLFTSRFENVRQMPGRLCGETVDAKGRRSYTLTLSTREQHIRREKATSNICTNQNLCALWSTIWLALVGKEGFVHLAEQNLAKTEYLKSELLKTGKAKLRFNKSQSFNEFVLDLKIPSSEFIQKCVQNDIAPGVSLQRFYSEDKTGILVAVTEKKSRDELDKYVELLKRFG